MKRFDKRQTEIVLLLLSCDTSLSSQEMADKLNLSSKTIQRDIKAINLQLRRLNLEIISQRSKGFSILQEEKERFRELLFEDKLQKRVIPNMQEGREEWLLDRFAYLALENSEIDLTTLADALFVSLTTLKKDLQLVKEQLKRDHLSLEKVSNKGLKIVGSEIDIHTFIRERLFKNGDYASKQFSFAKIGKDDVLEAAISQLLLDYDVYMSDIGYMNFILHLQILIAREKCASKADSVFSEFQMDKISPEYLCACAILDHLAQTLERPLPESEVINIYIHLTTQKRLQVMAGDYKQSDDYRDLIHETLVEINEIYHYNFTKDTLLIEGLWVHLFSAIKRLKFHMKIENNLLEDIQKQYPFEIQLAQLLAKKLKYKLGFEIPRAEIGFLALHFCGANERRTLRANSEKLRVVLVCATGLGTSLLLKSKIAAKFSTRIQIQDTLSYHDLVTYEFNDTDLIISTILLNQTYPIPWLYVSSIVGDQDIASIESYLQGDKSSKIVDLLSEARFMPHLSGVTTRFEALTKMGEQLLAAKEIDAATLSDLIHREQLGTTEIGNLVAVPHCMSDSVLYPKLAIGILDAPVHWQYQDVQIIVIFFMNMKNKGYLQSIIQGLYVKLSQPKLVASLTQEQSYDHLKTLLL